MKFNKLVILGVGLEMQEIIPNYFVRKFLHSLYFRARKENALLAGSGV